MDDLQNIVNNASVYMFADDTSLRSRSDNTSRLNEALKVANDP